MKTFFYLPLLCCLLACDAGAAGRLAQVIDALKPSVVGIGSYRASRNPPITFVGTGFAVGDGLSILTAAHVTERLAAGDDSLGVLLGHGASATFRSARVLATDREHDLALLRIGGDALPALQLGDSGTVMEGQALAFTGFPLGMVLGLHHVTHRAMVSAITPVVMPALNARKLDVKTAAQLQRPPYAVFQLDATAYPGNSGSPLYDPETGLVYGIINMVYVKSLKESAISAPSGISYAIPGNFMRTLLREAGLNFGHP